MSASRPSPSPIHSLRPSVNISVIRAESLEAHAYSKTISVHQSSRQQRVFICFLIPRSLTPHVSMHSHLDNFPVSRGNYCSSASISDHQASPVPPRPPRPPWCLGLMGGVGPPQSSHLLQAKRLLQAAQYLFQSKRLLQAAQYIGHLHL